jgi:DNA-3-methyladenine glycosylase
MSPGPGFYLRDARIVARELLGMMLTSSNGGGLILSGRIVETEAYLPGDPASHAWRGPTARNASMYLEGGRAYVYVIYGVHRCFNVVTGPAGEAAAVLIRALEPVGGIPEMWVGRYGEPMPEHPPAGMMRRLCAGPGRLCAALGIETRHDGEILRAAGPISIVHGPPVPEDMAGHSRRIGLSPGKGEKELLRWYVRDSPCLSRKDAV